MKDIKYPVLPLLTQFKSDSSVTFALRKDDRILAHLDWLLERYWAHDLDYSMRRVILADLFLTANTWIRLFHAKHPKIRPERYPAVLALFESVVNQLGQLLGCNRAGVAQQIEEIYGRDLTPIGARTDSREQARYYGRVELAHYRIRFKNGVAYHFNNANGIGPMHLVPLNSADYDLPTIRNNATSFFGWAPYVMTLEREFYMSTHWLNEPGRQNVFHSAYTGGAPVAAAGTMLVQNGRVMGLRSDSGHYHPLPQNTAAAIQGLHMYGVNPLPIKIYDWAGNFLGTALDFMRSRMRWEEFEHAQWDRLRKRGGAAPFSGQPAQLGPYANQPLPGVAPPYANQPLPGGAPPYANQPLPGGAPPYANAPPSGGAPYGRPVPAPPAPPYANAPPPGGSNHNN